MEETNTKKIKKKRKEKEKNKLRVLWTFCPFRLPREAVLPNGS
jgi:hypothetical protein